MSFVVLSARDVRYSGPSAGLLSDAVLSPYNYLSPEENSLYQLSAPFSVSMTSVDSSSPIPYRMTLISPDYYLYTELDQEEYKRNVINRGQHMHNTYEIVYTREGEFYQQIEARRYKYTACSCCLLNSNIRHREEYTGQFSIVSLSLAHDFLEDLLRDPLTQFFPGSESIRRNNSELLSFFDFEIGQNERDRKHYLNFSPCSDSVGQTDAVHDIFDEMTKHLLLPEPGSAFQFRALICRLIAALSDPACYSTQLVQLGTETEGKVFSQVTALMEESHGRISRSELSERLRYSGSYLNRIVNKYSGRSISEYGNFFAMQQAARLLNSTSLTITDIAYQLGFTDRTHFYELFREEYGMTPKQFRQETKKRTNPNTGDEQKR